MFVLDSDMTVWADVDDTLIGWGKPPEGYKGPLLPITVKYGDSPEMTETHWVIQENIEALQAHDARNHRIVLWSQGGWEWAKVVAEALTKEFGIRIAMVCSKPTWIYDDLPVQVWMPKRLWGKKKPDVQEVDPLDAAYSENHIDDPGDPFDDEND